MIVVKSIQNDLRGKQNSTLAAHGVKPSTGHKNIVMDGRENCRENWHKSIVMVGRENCREKLHKNNVISGRETLHKNILMDGREILHKNILMAWKLGEIGADIVMVCRYNLKSIVRGRRENVQNIVRDYLEKFDNSKILTKSSENCRDG